MKSSATSKKKPGLVPQQLEERKVRVGGQSKEIQKALFKLGFSWFYKAREIHHTDAPFLFLYANGQLAYGLDEEFYRDSRFREISADEIFRLSSTQK